MPDTAVVNVDGTETPKIYKQNGYTWCNVGAKQLAMTPDYQKWFEMDDPIDCEAGGAVLLSDDEAAALLASKPLPGTEEATAETSPAKPKRTLAQELSALLETERDIDAAKKRLQETEEARANQLKIVEDLWKKLGCPCGSARVYNIYGRDKIVSLRSEVGGGYEATLRVGFEDELKL